MRALPIVLRATISSAAAAACVLASTAVLCGCQTTPPPVGDRGGRMSPYNTTRQDRISTDANAPDLFSFGDTVAESLAASWATISLTVASKSDARRRVDSGIVVQPPARQSDAAIPAPRTRPRNRGCCMFSCTGLPRPYR